MGFINVFSDYTLESCGLISHAFVGTADVGFQELIPQNIARHFLRVYVQAPAATDKVFWGVQGGAAIQVQTYPGTTLHYLEFTLTKRSNPALVQSNLASLSAGNFFVVWLESQCDDNCLDNSWQLPMQTGQ